MENLSRIGKYLWPYRVRFVLSILCAVAIAALWCMNLSAVGPVVKVLFENNSLQEFVDQEIATASSTIELKTSYLNSPLADTLEKKARAQSKISDATNQLHTYETLKTYVMPYVPDDKFNTLSLILVLMFVGTLIKCGFIFAQEILIGSVVQRTANDIRRDCFLNSQNLDVQTVANFGTAGLLSRMTNDINQMMIAISVFGTKMIREPLKAAACIAVAFYINWRLTLMAVLIVPLFGVLLARCGRLLRKAARSTMESVAAIYDCIAETFNSFKIVTAFSGQKRQKKQFLAANNEYYTQMMKCIRVNALIRPSSEVLGVITVLLAFTPGAYMVLRNTDSILGIQLAPEAMTVTQLMMLYGLLAGTLDPIRKLSSVFGLLKQGTVGAERAFELVDCESLVEEPDSPSVFLRHHESIEFQDLSFRYAAPEGAELRPLSLQDVNLKVNFGEVVAVVGPNGSGKSTLLSILPRFMEPDSGEVKIDGVGVRSFHTGDLRSQIGLVSQETMLFNDTVFENIRYGNFDATHEDVENAARQAHATSFVEELPQGFETNIGIGGKRLSGGQRQRLALARAILRDPSILILDEATSAVDAQSEDLIHGVLKKFAVGRTVFIITHVLSETFLDLVDRVVVMDQGRILATGTHEQLSESCDVYRRLTQAGSNSQQAAA